MLAARNFTLRLLPWQSPAQTPLELVAGQQYSPVTVRADQTHICPQSHHPPAVSPAGMGLAQYHIISYLQRQDFHLRRPISLVSDAFAKKD
jgi:hypothetical protein